MKKFLAIIAITSIMASCTDSSTTEGTSTDTSAAPIQSAPDTMSTMGADTSAMRDTTTTKTDSPAVR